MNIIDIFILIILMESILLIFMTLFYLDAKGG